MCTVIMEVSCNLKADIILQDYNQQRPSQELVAKDLHGIDWRFRHVYRGQPRRHLLTTGWSVFVSHKRLLSGDAVLFLRGENGELRLGIRRAARQQNSIPSSVLSSQSMHLGVVAAAAHAVATKSMFHIFYNPRASPAEFLIPYHKYVKSCNLPLSIGMRFKMRFETEDAAERRYTGTITGIGDVEPARWPGSKWRSLKIKHHRLFLCTILKYKSATPEIFCTTAERRESPHTSFVIAPTSIPWALSPSSPFNFPEINNSESWPQVKFPVCRIIDSKKYDLHGDYQQPFNHHNSTWFDVPKTALRWQASPVLPFESEEIRSASCTANLLSSNPSKGQNKCIEISSKQHQLSSQTPATDADQGGDQGKHSCKLFGFSLIEEPACIDDAISSRIPRAGVTMNFLHMAHDQEPVQSSILRNLDQPLKDLHDHSEGLESSEHQITFQTISKVPTSVPALGRKCTKVHKQGNIVGRAVDLSKLDGYDELISELEHLFNMEGSLRHPEMGWQVAYTDNEGDMMLVGDDPWQRRKVATLLLKACDLVAFLWGFDYLALRAYEDDAAARNLYTRAGYKVVSCDPPWTSTWIGKKQRVLMVKRASFAKS